MWILLGLLAIAATLLNLYQFMTGKDYRFAMALGLSFTALTICGNYSLVSVWVKANDWAALEDVVPTIEGTLWFLTSASILLNMTPLLFEYRKKKTFK